MNTSRKSQSLLKIACVVSAYLATSQAIAATKCAIVTRGDAQVIFRGNTLTAPTVLPDCEGMILARGEVLVCVADDRGHPRCSTFVARTTLSSKTLRPGSNGRGFFEVIKEIFKGEVSESSAVSRRGRQLELPTGTTAFAAGDVSLDFSNHWLKDIERIEVTDTGTGGTVLIAAAPGRASLPKNLFEPGGKYAWTIRSTLPMLDETTGRFNVARDEELQDVAAETRRVSSNERAGLEERALMLAAWLQKHGLPFDARQVLINAGILQR